MKIIITGVTGLIGSNLANELAKTHQIIGLTRNPERAKHRFAENLELTAWDAETTKGWQKHLSGDYAIINLAGEPIAGKRWSKSQKERIINSRLNSVNAIAAGIENATDKPQVVIQASANGYYGQDPEYTFTEQDGHGTGFLADTTKKWEEAAQKIKAGGIRMPLLRTGIVLSKDGGALPELLKPFQFYAGGFIGSGQQWMSWIHITDHIQAVKFLLEKQSADGPYNLTAPKPVKMKTLIKTTGQILNKPVWTRVPGFALKTFMGSMADEMLLNGTKAMPEKLQQQGFQFNFPDIEVALQDILKKE
ncbi:MAG: TIGR01777 family oxidoreductase [Bacteroidales bacterium]